ncbi:hypothetical protein GCM10011390_41960 [Aureimonas endophytica]|uniref:Uncharacterized protein n=1 Tax=Aureimonas endophytica TaxID=2027858 RepID=A0A916ZYD8_9HYPH|nr:hypothetical protein [Aureimonas endophytica]GGE18366.1 hypothetical protein GCM10011390_41960 [Aureimonas endophytica]
MSQKSWEKSQLSNVAEASALMQAHWAAGSVKDRIRQAAREMRWSFSRASDLWYGKARRIDAHELDALRAATQQEFEEAANEYREVADRLARLEAMFVAFVEAQAGPQLAEKVARIGVEVSRAAGASAGNGARSDGRAHAGLRG